MLLACGGLLQAQQVYPVWVTPMPAMFSSATVYLGDFAHTEATAGRINYMLELRDPVELSRQVHFRLHVERNGTTVMMTDPGIMPPVITLQKNVPITINGTDLAFYFDLNHLVGVSGFALNNVLTEDFYSICIEVIDLLRQEPISDKVCVSGFLNQLSPPILYMPQPDAMLSFGQYNNMMFHWQLTGISLLFQSNIRYDLQVRELTEGIDNYQDAFESHNLIFDQTDLYNFSLVYDAAMPPLVRGKKYIWRVRAFARDFNGMEIPGYFHNNGYSEIWQFELPADNTSSGEFCNPREPKPVQNRVPLRELSVNDVVHVGHFDMTITSLDNSTGESSSGFGKVEIPFLDMEVEARFDNMSINEKKDAFAGQANVVQTIDLLSKLKAKSDGMIDFIEAGSFTDVDVENILAAATNNSNALTTRLPFSLKQKLKDLFDVDMPYDLIVTNMWFTSLGAKFNAMMLVPDGLGGYARFGASNIDVDNAGLALNNLFLFLAENTSMPGFDKQPVIVMAKGGDVTPEEGSYITFDCNGFKEFNLQGRYEFDKERAVRASNNSLVASANFTIKTTKWGEFVSIATIPDFAIQGMDDWRFHVVNAIADFSPDDKNGHKELLGDIDSLETQWKGFYIKELTVKLPQDLRFGNETALVMTTKNLLIDSLGANGSLSGQNLLALGIGNAGGWGLSFEEMNLHIVQDSFADAEVKGKIIATPVGDTIVYNGKLFVDSRSGHYALDLIPMGAIELHYIQGGFTFKPGSLVSIRKEVPFCVTEWTSYADLNVDLNMTMREGDFTKLGGPGMSDKMAQVKNALGTTEEFTFDVSGLTIEGLKINHPDLPEGRQFGYDDTSISNGEISLAGVNMNMGGFDLLEEDFELEGTRPGLGLGFHMSLGAYGIISKFWSQENGMEAPIPFSLALIEIDFPKVPKKPFNCVCKSPDSGSSLLDYCKPPVSPEGTTSLAVGSLIRIGHFEMEVVTLSNNNGKGKIPIPFLGREIEVDFQNLLIDEHGMMAQGAVRSTISPLFADLTEDALQKESGLLRMENLKDADVFMKKMNTHMEEMGEVMKFPVSVNDIVHKLIHEGPAGQFDFLLMGIHFGPDSATVNCLAIFKTPEGKYLKFGLAGIGLRPDGFDLEERKLFLDEEIPVSAYHNQDIRLLASKEGDPGSGSFIHYDCDGFKGFDLQAIYPFSNAILVNANNPGSSAEALLHIQAPTWGNFTSAAVVTPFMLPHLDGWSFEPVESGADFSSNQNLESIFFPGGYMTTGFDWQGLYVKKLKVTLPEDLRLHKNKKIEMEAENLVIDQYGVTCSLVGNDLLPMQHSKKSAVNLSLNELQLDIRKNQFEHAYIKGDAVVAPLLNPIAYEGIIYKEPITKKAPNAYYAIDIVPVNNYINEFVNINFSVGEGTYIAYRKRAMLTSNGQPLQTKNSPVYHYIRYAGINAHIVVDIPEDKMQQLMASMGYSYVEGCLNLLGIQHVSYHSEIGIKNMRIHHPSLPYGQKIGMEGYMMTRRLNTSGH